ncbi:MAG: LacI family DNA-binding transcriptional regulator [Spirochaetaceae bacterium]|jgi:LacI family transcriptional regulator|nr:LacI family DNA-binding transcriptional regulator [Spirochaetaceae bacterium]
MTVKEIAALANISIGTVDRVLYHRGRVAPETRARIEAIIEKYQFTPNPIARRLKRNRPYRFRAFLPQRDQDAGYWGQALAGIEEGAGQIAPLGVTTEIIEFDRYSAEGFQKAAASLLEDTPDGIILSPIMPEKIKGLIADIRSREIPCVFFDSDLPESEPLCAIGQDSFRGGYLAGRLMHLFAGKITKPVAILDAHGEDYHITRRRDGFLRYAGEQGFSTVVREYSGYKGAEITVEEIAAFLRDNRDITGIFITNCMAHRVVEAAHRVAEAAQQQTPHHQGERSFLLIGYDLIPKNREMLRTGDIDAIISQRPAEQGREALLNLYRHIVLEQRVLPKIDMPLDVYIKENIPVPSAAASAAT